ncbi:M23 family metallopeptidase [Candidatus Fermentibacteria bacterium]|nr:M23 family metallopeptidase [Candidatus Fermentibacteria bacterium]
MTLHLPPRKRPWTRALLYSGWALAAVFAVVAYREHSLARVARAGMSLAQQETARMRLLEQDLYRLKTRQDWLVGLLQSVRQSVDSDSLPLNPLTETAVPDLSMGPDSTFTDLAIDNPVPHLWPVTGWVTQEFRHPKSPRHQGIDIADKLGTPVVAPARGEVFKIYWDDTMGRVLEIQHIEGHLTRYAHLQTVEVQPGDPIEAGQMVARLGTSGKSTAPHLHYEVEIRGELVDPAKFLPNYDN